MSREDFELFEKLGFSKKEITLKKDFFNENRIPEKTEVFFYEAKSCPEASFYFFSSQNFSKDDLKTIHSRVWNENKVKLYFTKTKTEIRGYPSFTLPEDQKEIYQFALSQDEESLVQSINKNKIDSGYFWIEKFEILKKRKKLKTVNEELIEALVRLKEELEKRFKIFSISLSEKEEVIQALIDRTLFIKFLEDRHIINSGFYSHYFQENDDYKVFIQQRKKDKLNRLFEIINKLFSNELFDKHKPKISKEYLNDDILECIYHMIAMTGKDGQLSLFDFEFDILPIEFIGHIYQVFQNEKKSEEGIVYTPENLAKLLVDETIGNSKQGKILDPACGSGVFLVLALRKLIQNTEETSSLEKRLKHRIELLSRYIYGIEKSKIAYRITIFSLYLEVFHDLPSKELKELIISKIQNLSDAAEVPKLFQIDLSNNIVCGNSLDTENPKFSNIQFDFILGNPPWKKVKDTEDENKYWKLKQEHVGNKQLSQIFMVKLKDWEHTKTKFGLVVNSSNFYNEDSQKFRKYFFSKYTIKTIYDLSEIKDLLFKNATESAFAILYSAEFSEKNEIQYSIFEANTISKMFDLVFIREEKQISIKQDLLIENPFSNFRKEFGLIKKLDDRIRFDVISRHFALIDNELFHRNGMGLMRSKTVQVEFGLNKSQWQRLESDKQEEFKNKFLKKYLKESKTEKYNIPYLRPKDIEKLIVLSNSGFISENDTGNFYRPTDPILYIEDRIVYARLGTGLKAIFLKDKLIFSDDLNVIKLKDKTLNILIAVILNSSLINFYINNKYRRRIQDSFPKTNIQDINNIPIPKNLEDHSETIDKINELYKRIPKTKNATYEEVIKKLDELVFDLYDLNIIEKDLVNDFFIKSDAKVEETNLKEYCQIFYEVFQSHLKKDRNLFFQIYRNSKNPLGLAGIQIKVEKLNSSRRSFQEPVLSDTVHYVMKSISENFANTNLLTLQDKIVANNSIYIIREERLKNWSRSRAVEDAKYVLRRFQK